MPPPAILLPEEFLGIIRISDKERQIIEHFRKDVFEVIYRLNHGSFKVFSSDNTAAAIRDLISDLFGLKRNWYKYLGRGSIIVTFAHTRYFRKTPWGNILKYLGTIRKSLATLFYWYIMLESLLHVYEKVKNGYRMPVIVSYDEANVLYLLFYIIKAIERSEFKCVKKRYIKKWIKALKREIEESKRRDIIHYEVYYKSLEKIIKEVENN